MSSSKRDQLSWSGQNKFKRLVGSLFIVVGVTGLALGAVLYFRQPKPPSQTGVSLAQAPSSTKPSRQHIDDYTVAPDLPKYISIPAIGVPKTRIMPLGLMKNSEIAAPNNIYDAGWYDGSTKPGQNGAMFIFGHVSSWEANGIFYNLKKLQPGNKIFITRGDNKQFIYQVVSSKVYPYNKVDMNQVLSPMDSNKPGLNLMTCAGHIIKGTSEFSERLVVFTSLADS